TLSLLPGSSSSSPSPLVFPAERARSGLRKRSCEKVRENENTNKIEAVARISGSPRPLARRFYARDPRRVARDLLGKLVVRGRGKRMRAGRTSVAPSGLKASDQTWFL